MSDPVVAAPLCCGNCESYRRRHADPEVHAAAERVGHPISAGLCWRYPTPVSRSPEDCCGEHSTLMENRMAYQAGLLAAHVARLLPPREKL